MKNRAAKAQLVPALLIGVGAAVRGVFLLFPALDSDQAIIGLMGLHILEGRFPFFFWGEPYSGTLESFLAALLFFVFGVSRQTLALAPLLVSLGFLWAGWRLAREILGERGGLIALALLAIPPVFLSWNGVLPRGNYIENLFFGTLCLLLAWRLGQVDPASPRARRWGVLLGGLGGFAWYMSFQSAAYLVVAAFHLAWRQRLGVIRLVPYAGPAFLVGSLPFWVHNLATGFASLEAIRSYSGRVGVSRGVGEILAALPVLLGARGFSYTYEHVGVGALPLLAPLVAGVFGAGVVVAVVAGVRRRDSGVVFLTLYSATVVAVILLGGVSLGGDLRYLLPLYSGLPLLAAGGFALGWRCRSLVVGILAISLVSNLYGHWTVARGEIERFPRYRAEDRQLLELLTARGLTYVYAPDYWQSYWLTFDAREDIVVATPFWRDYPRSLSKFPPYTSLVRAEGPAAYLLWGSVEVYRSALQAAGIRHEVTRIGRFTVLHGFRRPSLGSSLPSKVWHGRDDSAGWAFDRDPWSAWQGIEFRLDLGAVHRIGYLVLHLGDLHHHPSGFVIDGSVDGQSWQRLADLRDVVPGFAWAGEKLLLEEHGRIGVSLPPTSTRHLRIAARPAGQPWGLAEVFTFEADPDAAPSPRFLEGVALEEDRRWGEALSRYAALLLDEPDDEPTLTRAIVAAQELRLAGWPPIYDVLSARHLGRDPELALRFARRFHEVADRRDTAWRRLVVALEGVGALKDAEAVEAARIRHFTPAVTQDVQFGRFVRFLGYTFEPPILWSGDTVEVSYYWQILRPLPPGLWAFAHVHDGKGIRLSHDHRLLGGLTDHLRPGEIVRRDLQIEIPPEFDAGIYSLRVGVWEPASGRRLRVWRGLWPTGQRVVTVGTLKISGRVLAEGGEEP